MQSTWRFIFKVKKGIEWIKDAYLPLIVKSVNDFSLDWIALVDIMLPNNLFSLGRNHIIKSEIGIIS